MDIKKQPFGKTESGMPVDLLTLSNDNGLEVKISNYGGIVVSVMTPDRNGEFGDIVLGFDTLEEYVQQNPYFGCIVGRCANRIAQGKFRLNGVAYKLARNNGQNHLHGGIRGFDKVVWTAEAVTGEGEVGLKLTYLSRDGEEGYPGNLSVEVIYTSTHQNELKIDYAATTDQVTIVNLSNHSYFNLAEAGDVLGHEIMINADRFTPVDETLIPTGELRAVKGTPMDFTQPTLIGARINQPDEQLQLAGGYDHNWVLNNPEGSLILAARVKEPTSGRVMEVYTTQPGVQFYTGNFLDELVGKGGRVYRKRSGFCLETQHFPDSPNQPGFPSVVLRPGERYAHTTVFKFAVDR